MAMVPQPAADAAPAVYIKLEYDDDDDVKHIPSNLPSPSSSFSSITCSTSSSTQSPQHSPTTLPPVPLQLLPPGHILPLPVPSSSRRHSSPRRHTINGNRNVSQPVFRRSYMLREGQSPVRPLIHLGPGSSPRTHLDWRTLTENLTIPCPQAQYGLQQCEGLTGGPTLLALHAFDMYRRWPYHSIYGMDYRKLAYLFLEARRPQRILCREYPTIGTNCEILAHATVSAVIYDNLALVHDLCAEIRDRLPRDLAASRDSMLRATDIETGVHGALSMLRLVRQRVRGAGPVTESLAQELCILLRTRHFGYARDLGGGLPDAVMRRLSSVEDDLGLLTEMALMWPTASDAPAGSFASQLYASATAELIVILQFQLPNGNWPVLVGGVKSTALLERGAWYVQSCLRHLHTWVASRRPGNVPIRSMVVRALRRVEKLV